jgi:hypothetical protein
MKNKRLISLYDKIVDNLNMDNKNYLIAFNAITGRRDKIIEENSLYSKKIKLKTNWFNVNVTSKKRKKQ